MSQYDNTPAKLRLLMLHLLAISILVAVMPTLALAECTADKIEGDISIIGDLLKQDGTDKEGKKVEGKSDISRNISAIAIKENTLVLGADEGADLLIFDKKREGHYREAGNPCISLDGKVCGTKRDGSEADIEALAWGEKYLFALGSHSMARKSIKKKKKDESDAEREKKNRERLMKLKVEPSRDVLYWVEADHNGRIAENAQVRKISLDKLLSKHALLSRFRAIPSKENGIDIEGLAVKQVDGEDRLYIGFRGPVLRGNHAIIMAVDFNEETFKDCEVKEERELFFLNLDGRGIRGMATAGDDFLLLGGPVGDSMIGDDKERYAVYHWDGKEEDLLGKEREPMCRIEVSDETKAEGIEVLEVDEDNGVYRFVIVFDGAPEGDASVYECSI